LKSTIKRMNSFSVEKAVHVVIQLAQALSVAHEKGVIHRDVKSDNIMIAEDGSVKLMDFGLARLKESPKLTRTREIMGTAAYMSPEQADGRQVDQRTDLWSLGVVFYEMLTGRLPFEGDSDISTLQKILKNKPPALRTCGVKVPRSIQYVLWTLLEKDVLYRYPDTSSVMNDLHKSVTTSTLRLVLRTVKKNILILAIGLLSIGVLILAVRSIIQKRANIPPWLRQDAAMIQLTSESGMEHGSISPSGRYLAYVNYGLVNLNIKDLTTMQNVLTDTSPRLPLCPVWYPDESRMACVESFNTIMDIPIAWDMKKLGERRIVFKSDSNNIAQLSWSPDGQWLCSLQSNPTTSALWLHSRDGTVHRSLTEYRQERVLIQSAWHQDSRHLSFYSYIAGAKKRSIRTIDILTRDISGDLIDVYNNPYHWLSGGMAVDPEGRYIVYPDSCEGALELMALPIKENGMSSSGPAIRVTHFSGNGIPYWPYLTQDGRALSFILDASSQDICIAPLDMKTKRIGHPIVPVCTDRRISREGFWTPDGNGVVFLSQLQNRIDIFMWNRQTAKITRLTDSAQEKKQLRTLPDRPSVGYLCNGAIWTVPLSGGEQRRIYPPVSDNITQVYNYEWGATSDTVYAILFPGSDEPRNAFPLIRVNLSQGTQEQIHTFRVTNPPWIEIRHSPTGNLLAYRLLSIEKPDSLNIGVLNLKNGGCREVTNQYGLVPNGQLSWTADGSSLIYLTFHGGKKRKTGDFCITSLLDAKTTGLQIPERFDYTFPGQISPAGDEILLFVQRDEANIWALGDLAIKK
jgi:serine/threonine protein kinase